MADSPAERDVQPGPVKQALKTIGRLKDKLRAYEERTREPIAIVGLACRLPAGTNSTAALWDMLLAGTDATSQVPDARWPAKEYADPDARVPGKMLSERGAFIDEVDGFDAGFFGLSPRDAANLDPQARLVFEVACEAVEDGGIPFDELRGSRTGVFVGMMNNDYQRIMWRDKNQVDAYSTTGYTYSMGMNRLSYLLGLEGPSMAVDTACSSSLVTLHLASQSLRLRESNAAIVAGVNLILGPEPSIAFSKMGMLSPDGRCKTFDASADGYGRGEGCVVMVLKRLSDARVAGDHVWGIIRGSAVNHNGGRSNGYTAPSARAHAAAMHEALDQAGLEPGDISYIEAHGTGTALGDPIEMDGLSRVYGVPQAGAPRCYVGTIKTNIGHTESAAGVAGVAKAMLAMKYGVVPPNLHLEDLNPHISLQNTRFELPSTPQPWPEVERRYAAVCSYGAGGTNAHIVLEGVPQGARDETQASASGEASASVPYVLPLSAKEPEALRQLAERYHDWLAREAEVDGRAGDAPRIYDICYRSSLHRTHHPERLAVMATSRDSLREQLAQFAAGESGPELISGRASERPPKVAFVLSGHGSEWSGMASDLLASEPVFGAAIDACDAELSRYGGPSVRALIQEQASLADINAGNRNQPVIFTIQVALAALWASWGVRADAVVGHSLGEVAAAYLAGALTLAQAAEIISRRAEVVGRVRGAGGVALLGLGADQARAAIAQYEGKLWLSALNGPAATTVAGDIDALEQLLAEQAASGVFCRRVRMDFAAHSPYMDGARTELVQALSHLRPAAGKPAADADASFYSSVHGQKLLGASLDADYWGDNLRQPVRFVDAVEAMLADGYAIFVELSPHPVLLSPIQACARARGGQGETAANGASPQLTSTLPSTLPSVRRDESGPAVMRTSLAALHVAGAHVNWQGLYPHAGAYVDLPHYPWQRQRHWAPAVRARHGHVSGHPLIGEAVRSSIDADTCFWQTTVTCEDFAYLADHRVRDAVVFPGAGYIEMALAAGQAYWGRDVHAEEVVFSAALIVKDDSPMRLQVVLRRTGDSEAEIQIASQPAQDRAGEWTLNARCLVAISESRDHASPVEERSTLDISAVQGRCQEPQTAAEHYAASRQRGLDYGPAFQGVSEVHRRDGEALATVVCPPDIGGERKDYCMHPALLDMCIQVMLTALPRSSAFGAAEDTYVPVALARMEVFADTLPASLHVHARLQDAVASGEDDVAGSRRDGDGRYRGDIYVYDGAHDGDGTLLLHAHSMELQRLTRDLGSLVQQWLFEPTWELQSLDSAHTSVGQEASAEGVTLVFADKSGDSGSDGVDSVATRLLPHLERQGQRCILVYPGTRYGRRADHGVNAPSDIYELDPADPGQFFQLMHEIGPCTAVIHCWNLDQRIDQSPEQLADAQPSVEAVEAAQKPGSISILHLLQSLTDDMPQAGLWLLTQGAQAVAGSLPAGGVMQATSIGLARVIAAEYPALTCRSVDLGDASDDEVTALSAEIAAQIAMATSTSPQPAQPGECELALRGRERWVARLGQGGIYQRQEPSIVGREDGGYLITGGLGGLGLKVAAWLVERGARHLVLLGRRAPSASAQAHIAAMEAAGAHIAIQAVDVASTTDMERLFSRFGSEYPRLRGIIHAAGLLDDGLLAEQRAERFQRVYAAKVAGAWNLHRLAPSQDLDFMVLFSSAAGLLGNPGQASYAAGNAFLDALAHHRRASGLPAISIDWGAWAEVGMAARLQADRGDQLGGRGLGALTPEAGLAILDFALGIDTAQIAAMEFEAEVWCRAPMAKPRRSYFAPLLAAGELQDGPSLTRAQVLTAVPDERTALVCQYLGAQVAILLDRPGARIDPERSVFTLGFDSLMALELRLQLEVDLAVNISTVEMIDRPNCQAMADLVVERLSATAESDIEAGDGADAGAGAIDESMMDDVDNMSEEEMDRLLAQMGAQ